MKIDIKEALQTLKSGGVILYPTDTIWGIGCDATIETAIKKVFEIKKRQHNKSMIVLINNEYMLSRYVESVPEIAYELFELSTKPLTIIFDKAKNLPSSLVHNDGSIAIRIVKDDFCSHLIEQFRKPIVSTSANFSNDNSPRNYNNINKEIISAVDYVVKWNQNDNSHNSSSTIIKLSENGTFKILRK